MRRAAEELRSALDGGFDDGGFDNGSTPPAVDAASSFTSEVGMGDWNEAGATGPFTSLTGIPFNDWLKADFVVGARDVMIDVFPARTELPIAVSEANVGGDSADSDERPAPTSSLELRQVPNEGLIARGAVAGAAEVRGPTLG